MNSIRSRSPLDNLEGQNNLHFLITCFFFLSRPPCFFLYISRKQKEVRWGFSYREVHLTDFQMARWSSGFFFQCTTQGGTNHAHSVPKMKRTLETSSPAGRVDRRRPSPEVTPCNIQLSVNGRDPLLRLPLPPKYITLFYSVPLGKQKAIYKQWRLTICTDSSTASSEFKKKKDSFIFNCVQREKRRCWRMIEHLRIAQ